MTWPPYSFRGRGIDRFHRETRRFVQQSKYLLHAMRHQPILRVAYGAGYRELRISEELTSEIEEADISADRGELGRKHQRSCALLVRRLASEEQEHLLDEANQLGLAGFVAYVTD